MPNEYKRNLYIVSLVFLVIISVYFAIKSFHEVSTYGRAEGVYNTITVTGHGEVSAAPDIANVYFTLRGEAKTVAEAQAKVAASEGKALEALKANGVAEADIKTQSASFNPKYEYVYSSVVCNEFGCPPRPGRNVITGYEAYESINVKVRAIDSTGKIMEDLGKAGVSEFSGPNFDIDEKEGLKAQARKAAIDEAKAKADALARDLGVKITGVSAFSEAGDGFYPMMYDTAVMGMGKAESAQRAELPKGENVIASDVTITYEIK